MDETNYIMWMGILAVIVIVITISFMVFEPNKGITNEWISEWVEEASSCDTLECPSEYNLEGVWCVTRDIRTISEYPSRQKYDYDSINLKPKCIKLENG